MGNEKARVLLVDDVSAILEELLTFMELNEIQAKGASDLDEAIRVLETNPAIRVLACDVRLGRESGLSIVTRIRDNAALRARPFHYLFITGDPLLSAPDFAMPEHQVLAKPVNPQVLIEVLRGLLAATPQGEA